MTAFAVLPDFGFLTLGRRWARRGQYGAPNGQPGQVAKSAAPAGTPANTRDFAKKKANRERLAL